MALDIRDPRTFEPVLTGPDAPSDDDLSTCVHCGLCLNYCPTYRVTGLETESPRGRVYLMTQWKRGGLPFTEELARHIDLCLGCRTCEAVCPSGVPYGRIIEGGRSEVERLRKTRLSHLAARIALRQLVASPARLRVAGAVARAAQTARLARLFGPGAQLPPLRGSFHPPRGNVAPALGERRYRVAFLTGCVMPIFYPEAHRASVKLLQLAGCEVWFPPGQRCCGALFAHQGDLEGARRLRERNARAFGAEAFDVLVVNSAGCGSHLKDFYPNLGGRVQDLFQFLDQVGLPKPIKEVRSRVTYQDPCHLVHAQRIRSEPRRLMGSIPGLELVEMAHADICCGSAGLYNALEPAMSARILEQKMEDLAAVLPEQVVTANPGCQMQLETALRARGSTVPVRHLAELIAEAY